MLLTDVRKKSRIEGEKIIKQKVNIKSFEDVEISIYVVNYGNYNIILFLSFFIFCCSSPQ